MEIVVNNFVWCRKTQIYEKKIVEEQKQNSISKIHTLLFHDQADLYNARAHLQFYKEKK